MEHAPDTILFYFFIIAIFILMTAFMITAIILLKQGKKQSAKKMHLVGTICLTLGIICSVPIILVIGYILYLCIT